MSSSVVNNNKNNDNNGESATSAAAVMTPSRSPPNHHTGTSMMVPAKRGYKSHVPSACINCKKAHLACDVTRPCKRCVTLGKTDTCQDVKHKKRGRPRLRDKKSSMEGGIGENYEVMYGTIQTPAFNVSPVRDNRASTPVSGVSSAPVTTAHSATGSNTQSTSIAFIHEPIESFRRSPPPPTAMPSSAPPPPPSTPAPTQSHPVHHQLIAPATSSALSPSFSATASSASFSSTIQSFHLQQTPRLILDDATFDDGGDIFQQCMIPPYAPPVPSLPYTQSHVPESMSLQLKMDNAYAQRPASLPFSPSSAALLGSGPVNSSTNMNTKNAHGSIDYHGNTPHEDEPRSPLSPSPRWREQEFKQTRLQSWQPSARETLVKRTETTPSPPPPPSSRRPTEATSGKGRDQEQAHSHYSRHSVEQQQQRQQKHTQDEVAEDQAVTLFMSMEVCCARVSDQVTPMWGYYPQEFAHRSLYDFVSPKDTDRLARLHRLLLDNITQVAKENDPDFGGPPPPTERTTADFFHSMDVAMLSHIASGSRTFSDSLHIKTRSGEEELYEMLVCMGGGIGADLHDTSSLSKLYLIAQFRKHNYEVGARTVVLDVSSSTFGGKRTSTSGNSNNSRDTNNNNSGSSGNRDDRRSSEEHRRKLSTSPKLQSFRSNNGLSRPSLTSSSSFRTASGAASFSRSSVFDLRPRYGSSIPAHYAKSSHLNTVTRIGSAKVNVAPMTCQRTGSTSPSSTSPPSSSSSSWQRRIENTLPTANANRLPNVSPAVAAASSNMSGVMRGPAANLPPLSGVRESSNPYSTLAYRFAPIAAAKTATGSPQGGPNVTHPTTQYFLQTSSSTLNAAASAAQYGTRRNNMLFTSNMADNDRASGKTDSNRKVEMSIRSLLC
ncbi:hypothetical protein BCR43DRAFT_490032 [Syncephalastrum racemosum]|uniref:Zn(2)-C6 fungal-type domain-containing protein n=1 Tax=Syncephalastrum racemosum TaxID=13706 RepID=A0A1X2HFB0_SYNRA|nr:hypothetical protein BCR43DRAFT_490032 [Syncephalastrum racemosum]